MATSLDVINEWASDSEAKQTLVKTHSGLILRWLNQAQLRYADKSEMLKSRWTPTITSTGNIALPADFLREIPDRVQPNANATVFAPLRKVDYPDAILVTWTGLIAYSVYGGNFYVWAPQACTPAITYNKKPAALTDLTSDLEIPTEFHHDLILGLDIYWERRAEKLDLAEQETMWTIFDNKAKDAGWKEKIRKGAFVRTRGSWF